MIYDSGTELSNADSRALRMRVSYRNFQLKVQSEQILGHTSGVMRIRIFHPVPRRRSRNEETSPSRGNHAALSAGGTHNAKGPALAVSTLVNRANKYLWWSNPIMGYLFDNTSVIPMNIVG